MHAKYSRLIGAKVLDNGIPGYRMRAYPKGSGRGRKAERETIVASASWKDANRNWSNNDRGKRRGHGTAETKAAYTIRPPRKCPVWAGIGNYLPCMMCGQYIEDHK